MATTVSPRRLKLYSLQEQMEAIWAKIEEREAEHEAGGRRMQESLDRTIALLWQRFAELEVIERDLLRTGLMWSEPDRNAGGIHAS